MMPHKIATMPVERGVEGGGKMGRRRRMDVEGKEKMWGRRNREQEEGQ